MGIQSCTRTTSQSSVFRLALLFLAPKLIHFTKHAKTPVPPRHYLPSHVLRNIRDDVRLQVFPQISARWVVVGDSLHMMIVIVRKIWVSED
jgi:hypothetical protein